MNRGVRRRPYLFELLTLANFLIIFIIVAPANPIVLTSLPVTLFSFGPTLIGYAAIGVALRCGIAWYRGGLKAYLRILRSRGWLVDTARLVVFGALMVHTYFWIKLLVPLLHPVLYDQALWNVDRAMFFGYSPNVLFLELFSNRLVLKAIDISYARIFFASMTLAFVYFLSDPSRRIRVAFSNGNTMLWLLGAWLYLLIPSVGPAFRFPDVWLPFVYGLGMTQAFQGILIQNYQAVLRLPAGGSFRNVQLMLGVAAFPSLHVAFQTFVFLWMRRVWIYGEVVFGIFTLLILIGSVVTGWHYLIDGIAGIVMAIACYLAGAATCRVREWSRLRTAIRA
jgi:PAP2 superfamily protein